MPLECRAAGIQALILREEAGKSQDHDADVLEPVCPYFGTWWYLGVGVQMRVIAKIFNAKVGKLTMALSTNRIEAISHQAPSKVTFGTMPNLP